jgi:hypothetical protein
MSTPNTTHPRLTPRRSVTEFLTVPRILFWFGIGMFVLGTAITFIPGGEQSWFTISAGLLAFGFLVPGRFCRIVALVLVFLAGLAAFDGHHRGIEYRRLLERHRATESSRLLH